MSRCILYIYIYMYIGMFVRASRLLSVSPAKQERGLGSWLSEVPTLQGQPQSFQNNVESE